MSYELAVWHSAGPVRPEEAAEVYPGDRPPADLDAAPEHPLRTPEEVLQAVLSAAATGLTSEPAPQLSTRAPWASSPEPCGSAVLLSFCREQAEVMTAVRTMAARHGLVVFDLQTGTITQAATAEGTAVAALGPGVTLEIARAAPDTRVAILDRDGVVERCAVTSRRDAHARARAFAGQNDAPIYRVVDPLCLPAPAVGGSGPGLDDPDLPEVVRLLAAWRACGGP